MGKKQPLTDTDKKIGEHIRYFRNEHGFTQAQLAKQLGVSGQQLQKYESGFNRIKASRLYEIARYLDIPLIDFFEGDFSFDEVDSHQVKCCRRLVTKFLQLSPPQQEFIMLLVR